MKFIKGGICSPRGFSASSTQCGIRKEGRDDLALIFSEKPCVSAAAYTSNVYKAAPVKWDMEITKSDEKVSAVIINSGIANACTGEKGLDDCRLEAKALSDAFNSEISERSVLTASTGVIGMHLPIEKIVDSIYDLVPSLDHSDESGTRASKAIMTTDTVNKECSIEFELCGKTVRIGGMTKGSGMIHPRMCTMLCFITTDIAISKALLQKALSQDIKTSFNMISVDGDTSTNDTCIVLANGLSGNEEIVEEDENYSLFKRALHEVTVCLAKKMARDGEGASHLFEARVCKCQSKEKAGIIARSVISSTLTKAAIYGRDANWGRILCAMGYSGQEFDPDRVTLYLVNDYGKILLFKDGSPVSFDEDFARELLSQEEVIALIEMNEGNEEATAWGCDLTHDYVDINASYRS